MLTFFLVTILLSSHLNLQFDRVDVDFNNVKTQITNDRIFLNNVNSNKVAYEIPKRNENKGIYTTDSRLVYSKVNLNSLVNLLSQLAEDSCLTQAKNNHFHD